MCGFNIYTVLFGTFYREIHATRRKEERYWLVERERAREGETFIKYLAGTRDGNIRHLPPFSMCQKKQIIIKTKAKNWWLRIKRPLGKQGYHFIIKKLLQCAASTFLVVQLAVYLSACFSVCLCVYLPFSPCLSLFSRSWQGIGCKVIGDSAWVEVVANLCLIVSVSLFHLLYTNPFLGGKEVGYFSWAVCTP